MKTVLTQNTRHKKRTAKQIRFRQHANKIKKAWQGKLQKIQQVIQKILDEYADKPMEQQILLAHIELEFAIFRRPIMLEDPVKYELVLRWIKKRKAEVLSGIFFHAFKFQWENKYWVSPLVQLEALKEGQVIIKRNLLEGTPGDDRKAEMAHIYQKLQSGFFPDVAKFNPADIAEVMSGIMSLEYFEQEISSLKGFNTNAIHNPNNLQIQINQNDDSDTINDEVISINIPLGKITDALESQDSQEMEILSNEKQQPLALELYNRKQAAIVLQVSEPTLDKYVLEGKLNYCTIGPDGPKRFRREDLDACLHERNNNIRR